MLAVKLGVSGALLALLFSRVDVAKLWANARQASLPWIGIALALYALNVVIAVWRWWLLLKAQDVPVPFTTLFGSMSVSLFLQQLPAEQHWRRRRPHRRHGEDRAIENAGRHRGARRPRDGHDGAHPRRGRDRRDGCRPRKLATGHAPLPIWPGWLWAAFAAGVVAGVPILLIPSLLGRLLRPLTVLHPEWVSGRLCSLTATLERFRHHLGAIAGCGIGAVLVQVANVSFHFAVAHALGIHIGAFDMAVVVPMAGVVQMLPVSVNGFGVREAMFSFYFTRIGLPIEAAILLSLTATALVMLYS